MVVRMDGSLVGGRTVFILLSWRFAEKSNEIFSIYVISQIADFFANSCFLFVHRRMVSIKWKSNKDELRIKENVEKMTAPIKRILAF